MIVRTDHMVPTMVSIREASQRTGLTYILIKDICDSGRIVYIRSGKKYLVNFDSLLRLLQQGEGGKKEHDRRSD